MAEAELTTIARPYARAAFARGLDVTGGLGDWSSMLGLLAEAVRQKVVRDALDNPRLTTAQESQLLFDLLGDDINAEGRNFVNILAQYGRLSLLPNISVIFEQLKHQHEKTMDVSVTSAFDVEQADQDKLSEALRRRLQKEINLSTSVDKSLVGGVIVRTEDTVIDDSVRGKLEKLAHVLH